MKRILFYCSFFILFNAKAQIGLVASYTFNGNANDITGNNYTGTVYGATLTQDRFGNDSSAYYFNGISDYIDLGNYFSYGSHSFSCWALRDSVTGNVLISKINNGPYDVKNSEMNINLFVMGDGVGWNSVVSSNSTVDYSKWVHVVSTYDLTTGIAKIYVNGVVDSFASGYVDVSNTPLFIGARPNGPSFYFNGVIDEVNIYDVAISKQTVDSLYNYSPLTNLSTLESYNTLQVGYNFSKQEITINNLSNKATLNLYDLSGRIVFSRRASEPLITIDANNFKSGIYFYEIFNSGKVEVGKLLVY